MRGGGALTEEEINFLRFELNAQDIFNNDDFRNIYKMNADVNNSYFMGIWDKSYRMIVFDSIQMNVFNKQNFTSFDSFMKHLSSIDNNNIWINYYGDDSDEKITKYKPFRAFYKDVFDDIRYLRTVTCVYYYLQNRQKEYEYASKLMKLINITSFQPGNKYGIAISGIGFMAFGKYMYLGY